MNTPQDDRDQAEYLRQWKNRRGCLHWLWVLALALILLWSIS